MFLFIHDIGGSQSFWLAQIRGLFNLDKSFLDQELLDAFAVGLPGHNRLDKKFTKEGFLRKLNQIIDLKAKKQQELADRLIFSHDIDFITSLRNKKVTFVGHGLGGVLSMYYSLKNPTRVNNIISISCGNNFSSKHIKKLQRKYRSLNSMSSRRLTILKNFFKDFRKKNLYYLFSYYPNARGLKSALKIMKEWDFFDEFKKITLEDQLAFLDIRILTINGYMERLAHPKYSKWLKDYLNPSNPIFQSKKIILAPKQKEYVNVVNKVYPWIGKNPQDKDLVSFVFDVRNFLYGD